MRLTTAQKKFLSQGSDATFRTFVHDFLAFSARLMAVRAGFGELLGLSGPGYTILIAIGHLEGKDGVGVNQLAEHLHLSGAFVTLEVSKLVKTGLVSKRQHSEDKRRVLLTVTPKAQKMLDGLTSVQAPVNDKLFGDLTAEQFKTLAGLLPGMVIAADEALALLRYTSASRGRAARSPA